MEDDKNSKLDDPPESSSSSSPSPPPPQPSPSPPPRAAPSPKDQSISKDANDVTPPQLNNEELDVSQIQPKSEPVSSYSVVDGEMDNKFTATDESKEPTKTDNNYNSSSSSSYNPSKLGRMNEIKIIAKPSPTDDDTASPVPFHNHRRNVSMDHVVAKVPNSYFTRAQSAVHRVRGPDSLDRGQIDTTAPFESVKAAVSKFGGIVDWKAHRVQTVERRKFIEQELAKAQEEIPVYKHQCEAAEEAKKQVLKNLDSTRRLIEELKLNLERAQTEEQQAKQDSELAKLRVEELEQGIADEASFAAKAQLEVAKARHAAAVSELKSTKEELEQLRSDYDSLLSEKDLAIRKAEEAVAASKEIEKSVEDLTIELLTVKQSLESAHAAHLEAEEHRIAAVMAKEQESLNWEKELRQAEEELERLNESVDKTKELKLKLSNATELLHDLKSELATYMEAKPGGNEEGGSLEEALAESDKKTRAQIHIAIATAKRELAEVRENIEKTNDEVSILKVAATSLKSDLEKETAELASVQQRDGSAIIAIGSLEAELSRIKLEIREIEKKEEEERAKMGDLPKRIQEAALEADQARGLVEKARDALQTAKEEAEQAKAGANTREARLRAVEKEIKAAKTSEKLALAAMTALQESESSDKNTGEDSTNIITLSLEEYYELSKRAHEAEEQANTRVAAALAQVEAAKASESQSLNKLEEVSREVANRKGALETAAKKAEAAMEAKQAIEQELRKWRENDEKRKAEAAAAAEEDARDSSEDEGKATDGSSGNQKSNAAGTSTGSESSSDRPAHKKKKKSFFPRIFMFLARRKSSHSSKNG